MDGYIEFLRETLVTEASLNNLILQEGNITTKIKDAINWIVKQIGNLINFITSTVMKVLTKALSIFKKKQPPKTAEEPKSKAVEAPNKVTAPQKFTVPKAVGFANDVTNNLSKDKIISLCHSKNDRRDEIKKKQNMIVERCQNARKLDMCREVGLDEFNRLKSKSEGDIERATVHIESIKDALDLLRRELNREYAKESDFKMMDLLEVKMDNTKAAITMVSVVLTEFTKTVAWQTQLFIKGTN